MKNGMLNKMASEVLSQMMVNGDISDNFSEPLKRKFLKIGLGAIFAGLLSISSGVAQASDEVRARNVGFAINGLFGMLTSGSKPEGTPDDCQVQGTSGMKVGGAGMIGTRLGNEVGGGSGTVVATIALGTIGMVAAQASEDNRIRKECANYLSQRSNYYGIPRYATTSASPQSPILYEGKTVSGKRFYVTLKDSPGIAGLLGKVVGRLDLSTDRVVQENLDQGYMEMKQAYENLDAASRNYLVVAQGNTPSKKLARYSVSQRDMVAHSELNRENALALEEAKRNRLEAFQDYARSRTAFAHAADSAVLDGYNITQYNDALHYVAPPESATIYYHGKVTNKFAVVSDPVRP